MEVSGAVANQSKTPPQRRLSFRLVKGGLKVVRFHDQPPPEVSVDQAREVPLGISDREMGTESAADAAESVVALSREKSLEEGRENILGSKRGSTHWSRGKQEVVTFRFVSFDDSALGDELASPSSKLARQCSLEEKRRSVLGSKNGSKLWIRSRTEAQLEDTSEPSSSRKVTFHLVSVDDSSFAADGTANFDGDDDLDLVEKEGEEPLLEPAAQAGVPAPNAAFPRHSSLADDRMKLLGSKQGTRVWVRSMTDVDTDEEEPEGEEERPPAAVTSNRKPKKSITFANAESVVRRSRTVALPSCDAGMMETAGQGVGAGGAAGGEVSNGGSLGARGKPENEAKRNCAREGGLRQAREEKLGSAQGSRRWVSTRSKAVSIGSFTVVYFSDDEVEGEEEGRGGEGGSDNERKGFKRGGGGEASGRDKAEGRRDSEQSDEVLVLQTASSSLPREESLEEKRAKFLGSPHGTSKHLRAVGVASPLQAGNLPDGHSTAHDDKMEDEVRGSSKRLFQRPAPLSPLIDSPTSFRASSSMPSSPKLSLLAASYPREESLQERRSRMLGSSRGTFRSPGLLARENSIEESDLEGDFVAEASDRCRRNLGASSRLAQEGISRTKSLDDKWPGGLVLSKAMFRGNPASRRMGKEGSIDERGEENEDGVDDPFSLGLRVLQDKNVSAVALQDLPRSESLEDRRARVLGSHKGTFRHPSSLGPDDQDAPGESS